MPRSGVTPSGTEETATGVPAGSNGHSDAAAIIAASAEPGNRGTYHAIRALTTALSKGWRLSVSGVENIPATGPALLAPNHLSFLDSPLLMFCLPRRVWFLGKAEYLDDWKTRHLFPAVGMIPLARGGKRAALTSMRAALDVLGEGELLGIFPEGTRSRDGRLHRGHTGAAWLALKSGAPIIPVGISGTADIQPPGARLPRLVGECHIAIGEPLPMHRYSERGRASQRNLTDDLMFEISMLSGQTYIDEYAVSPDQILEGS